ncbi:MAG: class I tRNA ligase family protein [Candidatus Dojkabacteria bacterium]|nr:MAG: class I tRNA ligase family protein [Candidatus Dojkabacteria bacterium]
MGVSWPYASGNIHMGHLAGQYVVCDIFARYHRLKGNQVLMVSGSDCHGAPVEFKAEEQGISPEELAQKSHDTILDTYKRLGFLYECYTKTATENHKVVAQNLFTVLKENGYLITQTSKQYYDPKVDRFLPDRYVRGTCPNCKATNARGDECPECGTYLEPEQLIDPYSTLSDATPIMKETEHFYVDLKSLEPKLQEYADATSKNWRKWVREFSLGWLRQGLEPRPITRDTTYGVPVPVEGWEKKSMYVWFEAVIGYLSAAIEWADNQGEPGKWQDFWKNPEAKHYYFIAGGNVPFHTIMWPGEIIGYNEKYQNDALYEANKLPGEDSKEPLQLPFDVPANNMLFYRGKKMSKGDGTGITVDQILDLFGPDALRFFFARYAPENQDREFIWKDFIDANNNELVANLGNFINRTLIFVERYFEGRVPEGSLDAEVEKAVRSAFNEVGGAIEKAKFVKATEELLALGFFANKYFNDSEPWVAVKDDSSKAAQTIHNCVQIVNAFRVLLKPFTPFAADKLSDMLNYTNIKRDQEYIYDANADLERTGKVSHLIDTWFVKKDTNDLPVGHQIGKAEILFPKFEYSEELEKQDKGE